MFPCQHETSAGSYSLISFVKSLAERANPRSGKILQDIGPIFTSKQLAKNLHFLLHRQLISKLLTQRFVSGHDFQSCRKNSNSSGLQPLHYVNTFEKFRAGFCGG